MISSPARYLFLIVVLWLGGAGGGREAAAQPFFAPYNADVFFSRTAENSIHPPHYFVAKPVWVDQIHDPSEKPLYNISLEPVFSVGDYVSSLWLVLKPAGSPSKEENLLWCDRGLEPFMFVARGYSQGLKDPIYGVTRTITSCRKDIIIIATVLDAQVSPIPNSDDFQWDVLHMKISVNSASKQDPRTASHASDDPNSDN